MKLSMLLDSKLILLFLVQLRISYSSSLEAYFCEQKAIHLKKKNPEAMFVIILQT